MKRFINIWVFLVLLAFLIIMIFIDKNNVRRQIDLSRELNELRSKEQQLKDQIRSDSLQLDKLRNDLKSIEKIARERYFMKGDSDLIFVIERSKANTSNQIDTTH